MTRPPDHVDTRVARLGRSRVFYRATLGEPGRRPRYRHGRRAAGVIHPIDKSVEAVRHIVPGSN